MNSWLLWDHIYIQITWLPDFIGCLGTALVLVAYGLLQSKHLNPDSLSYSLLNILGAILILFSLFYAWNLPAFVMETSWLVISLFGAFNLKRKTA